MTDLTSALSHAPPGSWQRLTLPLARFAHGGADLSNVEGQFTVESSGALGMSVADVRFVQAGAPRGSQRTLSHRVRISSRMPIA